MSKIVLTVYNVASVAEKTGKTRDELWAMLKDKTDAGKPAVVKVPVIGNPGVLPKPKMITEEFKNSQEEWIRVGYIDEAGVSRETTVPPVDTKYVEWDD